MFLKISEEIIDRIRSIKWFQNCGSTVNNNVGYKIKYANTWESASDYFNHPTWEDTTLEARNELTSFLNKKYRNEYSKWNVLTREAKGFLEKEVMPEIVDFKEKNSLNETFVDCVKWDLLGAIMEQYFYKCKNRPTFFLHLLTIYEEGNFPCGWEGEYPKGELVIY